VAASTTGTVPKWCCSSSSVILRSSPAAGPLINYPLQRGSLKFDAHSRLAECLKRCHVGTAGYPEPNFLEARLNDLQGRIQRGAYRAKPSRRVWIPKSDGRQRPLGIAALEDKVVQHAVGTILNQIWEEDFLGFSYGFRPGRSQ